MIIVDLIAAAGTNPFDGITPNFNAFGTAFDTLWKKLLGAAWGLGLLACVFFLIKGIVEANSYVNSGHPAQARESRQSAKTAGITLGLLSALPVIVGGILFVTA